MSLESGPALLTDSHLELMRDQNHFKVKVWMGNWKLGDIALEIDDSLLSLRLQNILRNKEKEIEE